MKGYLEGFQRRATIYFPNGAGGSHIWLTLYASGKSLALTSWVFISQSQQQSWNLKPKAGARSCREREQGESGVGLERLGCLREKEERPSWVRSQGRRQKIKKRGVTGGRKKRKGRGAW